MSRQEYARDYYQRNKERLRLLRNERIKVDNSAERRGHLRRFYNMTLEEFNAMLERQGGGCALCKNLCPSGKSLSVDHDHKCCPGKKSCGKCIRGLLCITCNRCIGWLEKIGSPAISEYLGVS